MFLYAKIKLQNDIPNIPLIHPPLNHQILPKPTNLKPLIPREFLAPSRIMARKILMHRFIDAAMKSEIMLIAFETGGGAEDAFGAGLFVDSRFDGEVVHGFHFAGTELEDLSV
jgi:hypothetical protein